MSVAWWIKTILNLFLSLELKAWKLVCNPYGFLTLTVISQGSRRGHGTAHGQSNQQPQNTLGFMCCPAASMILPPVRQASLCWGPCCPFPLTTRPCLNTTLPPQFLCHCSMGWLWFLFTCKQEEGRGCYNIWKIRNWFLPSHFIVPAPDSVPQACHLSAGMAVWQKQSLFLCCGSLGPSGTHLPLDCL